MQRQAANGVMWSIVASGSQQVLSLLIFAILARQLTPLEFGIMGMAAIFLEIVNLIGRAGLIEVLVQRKDLSEDETSTAFWSSLALGLLGTLLLWGGAGLISAFFQVPEVARVVQWLALVPTINAMATVHEALLRRVMGFRILALRGMAGTLVSGGVAVLMATTGFGVMSLVAQSLVAAVLTTGVMWYCTRWTPSLAFVVPEFKRQMRMGTTLCVSTLLGMGNQRIVDLVVGHVLGAVSLGYMRVAWRGFDTLLDLGMRPVVQVTFPVFSRLQQDLIALSSAYIRLARLTALIIYPIFIGSILVAPEIIRLAFGDQWESSIVPMQVLALSVLSMPMIYFKSNALVAVGHARPVLWLNVLEFGVSFGIVFVLCRYGIEGAAWGNVLRVIVVAPPIMWALQHYVGIHWKQLLGSMIPATVCTGLMVAAALAVRLALAPYFSAAGLLVAIVTAGAICYGLVLVLLYRGLFDELVTMLPGRIGRLAGVLNVWKARGEAGGAASKDRQAEVFQKK
ncbi:hypothetical protein UC35_09745 [Ramlibacter tataouinensis]|uniref:Uncharacterized protein n=1 Tax=Ramlibacter tataouinensis TaxID=94132 RepID=A0A127JTB2_9BURK|nr:hypothetical protein UC35_09745 [Ramlibacter tataouinensis]